MLHQCTLTKCLFFFRRALRRGESVKYLIQDIVIDYIRDNHLYGVEDKWVIRHALTLYYCSAAVVTNYQPPSVSVFILVSFLCSKFLCAKHCLIDYQSLFFFISGSYYLLYVIFVLCGMIARFKFLFLMNSYFWI